MPLRFEWCNDQSMCSITVCTGDLPAKAAFLNFVQWLLGMCYLSTKRYTYAILLTQHTCNIHIHVHNCTENC